MNRRRMGYRLLLAGLVIVGTWQIGQGLYIHAKALLAQELLERAWQKAQKGELRAVPWPWADTWPVARLRAPDLDVERLVLAGDSGNALAFGPGHANASAQLGTAGLAVIGGHRDTHFAFLRRLPPDATLQLQLPDGSWREYRVETLEVVDASTQSISPEAGEERLLLVTCYPFDALQANGPLRYVVGARSSAPITRRVFSM
jgi:sortase A